MEVGKSGKKRLELSGCRRWEGAHRGEQRPSVATAPVSLSSMLSTCPQNILSHDHDRARQREDIRERTSGIVVPESGSPFVVSGELFLRSVQELLFNDDLTKPPTYHDPPLQSTTNATTNIHVEATEATAPGTTSESAALRHPSAGLLAGLSKEFRNLLLCHPDLDTTRVASGDSTLEKDERQRSSAAASPCESSGDCVIHLLSSARRERRLVRLKRIERLEASKMTVKCMATARVMAVQKAADEFKQRCGEEIKRLESDLYGLILRFAATVKTDMAEENRLTAAERDLCEREKERLDMAAKLASVAATVEHRTRGNVSLRRLPPTHPQYARCMRAATENVKPGFFSDDSPYSALRVQDIYKIDNRCLLDKFQRAAEATESPKVKGLFCHVPGESLEYVVLNGMGSLEGDGTTGANTSAHRPAWDEYPTDPIWSSRNEGPFRRAVRGGRGNEDVNHDTVVNGTGPSKPLDFPRSFSRYSTLEEEREYANPPNRTRGTRGKSLTTTFSDGRRTKEGQKPSTSQTDFDEGDNSSQLRLLALCRVMIGRLRTSYSVQCLYRADESVTAQGSAQRVTAPPGVDSQPSAAVLPCPSPGQAELDSMYFSCEKEYRLFNKAYVVPEFIVVHRFVARPSSTSPSLPSVVRRPRAVTFGGRGLRTAVGTQGAREGGNMSYEESRGRSDGKSVGASRTAASVVAGKEAAMNRAQPSAPFMFDAPSSFQGLSGPSTDSTRDVGVGAGSRCTTDGSARDEVSIRGGERQERGSGRASREFIVKAVEDTFERFWLELDKLRKLQKDEVMRSATYAKVPRQPP